MGFPVQFGPVNHSSTTGAHLPQLQSFQLQIFLYVYISVHYLIFAGAHEILHSFWCITQWYIMGFRALVLTYETPRTLPYSQSAPCLLHPTSTSFPYSFRQPFTQAYAMGTWMVATNLLSYVGSYDRSP